MYSRISRINQTANHAELSHHWSLEFLRAWKTGAGETEARHKKHFLFFFTIWMSVYSFLSFSSLVSENVAFLDMLDILVENLCYYLF